MEHTKEPWVVIEKSEHHGTYVEDEHGDTVCDLYVLDRISDKPIEQDRSEANARRIVACVNACVGVPTEKLEGDYYQGFDPWSYAEHLKAQREELLAALKKIRLEPQETMSNGKALHAILNIAKRAITKVEKP